MKQFYLAETTTKDNLVHQGIYFEPRKKSDTALLWVHGLTGRFYGDVGLFAEFAEICDRENFGFAAFNNRGHDVVANIRKTDKRKRFGYKHAMYGAGLEKFTDCILDIDSGINFLINRGFNRVILAGHSTGANKVCYYAGTKHDSRVAAVILAGPMSDRFSRNTDKKNYGQNLKSMTRLIKNGHGDEITLSKHFFPMTPKRWMSLLTPNTPEDVFNYGDKENILSVFSKIKKPLLVVFSELDETADRPIPKIKNIFDTHTGSRSYKSIVIPQAPHSYTGQEKVFVSEVINWVKTL